MTSTQEYFSKDFLDRIVALQAAQAAALGRIAQAIETIAMTNAPAPNFVKPISAYADFDFTTIGATVRQYDANGPTDLDWGGYSWTRRSPQNKFGEAIWFSRAIGKDAEGNNKYARLITFKKMSEAEPLPRKVESLIEHKPDPQPEPVKRIEIRDIGSLDEVFGPNPRAEAAPHPTDPTPAPVQAEAWPTTKTEFDAWVVKHKINGKETRQELGTDLAGWLKANPGKTVTDAAKLIAAVLGPH